MSASRSLPEAVQLQQAWEHGWEDEEGATDEYLEVSPARQLCEGLAQAVVLREAPPSEAAEAAPHVLPRGASGLSLALAGDESGSGLLHLPVMEQGRVTGDALMPTSILGEGTAAWDCFNSGQTLVWRSGRDGPAQYEDWRAALMLHPAAQAVVTAPLATAPDCAPLGAATFVLEVAPAEADVALLEGLATSLARSISHHTKHLWECSLEFLNHVIPRRMINKMLSATLTLSPAAAAAAAAPDAPMAAAVAAVAAARAGAGAGGGVQAPEAPGTPNFSSGGSHAVQCRLKAAQEDPSPELAQGEAFSGSSSEQGEAALVELPPLARLFAATAAGKAGAAVGSGAMGGEVAPASTPPLSPLAGAAPPAGVGTGSSGGGGGAGPAVVKTLRQKWNLEFADPVLEESYKLWFNTMQTHTDCAVFKYFSVLLLALLVALVARGGMTWGDVLAFTHGFLSLVVLAAVMHINTRWYIAHRSTVVAAVRISSAALLLVHTYLDPAYYGGSLLKQLTGTCSLTLLVNSFRFRLRFSNHLLVQLAKLYLCAMANAFIYSDPARASRMGLSLTTTSLLQLACVLLPSTAVFRMEAGMRRKFLEKNIARGLLQLPPGQSSSGSGAAVQGSGSRSK